MEFFRTNTIKVLKELIKNCKNAEELLRNSASEFEDPNLKKIFLYYADQNSGYIRKLNSEILRLGGSTEDLYEEDNYFYDEISSDQDRLKICKDTVNNTVKNYKEISLREDILWEVIPVIAKQYYGELEAQEQLQVLSKGA